MLFRGEGINSCVVIADRAGLRQFYVSGKAEASSAPADMRLERMMGHIAALAEVLSYREFPNDLFHGSDARVDALRTLLRAKR